MKDFSGQKNLLNLSYCQLQENGAFLRDNDCYKESVIA